MGCRVYAGLGFWGFYRRLCGFRVSVLRVYKVSCFRVVYRRHVFKIKDPSSIQREHMQSVFGCDFSYLCAEDGSSTGPLEQGFRQEPLSR